jgi:hypothetical protein
MEAPTRMHGKTLGSPDDEVRSFEQGSYVRFASVT